MRSPLACFLVLVAALSLLAPTAFAQDRGIPDASYFAAIDQLYRGDYRRAERAFTSELRGAVKTVTTRWVDSICFHAMLGETYYRQGRNADALVEFDNACRMFLSYADFMNRAQFPALRPEGNRARRLAPWARTSRQVVYATLAPTQLIQIGRVDNTAQAERGGLIQTAQFWRLNISEVLRTTALAIRRRTELLGPLAPHDALSRSLEERLSRSGLAPAGSWANTWVELLTGLAKMSVDKPKEALPYLQRATLLEGRYDHPLTGVALLAQGEAAMAVGNRVAAGGLLVEAGLAAFAFEDADVVDRALSNGHANHLAAGVAGPYPLLEGAIAWADRERFEPLGLSYRLSTAESLLAANQVKPSLALLQTRVRNRDLNNSPLATRTQFLTSRALYASGAASEAGAAAERAFSLQASHSPLGFQTQLADARFDSGNLSARLAVQVYDQLLTDPAAEAWQADPHDVLSHLKTPREATMARWFAAHIGRREYDKAIRVADLAKRRRFFAALPMGGRLLALRNLLDPAPGAPPLAKELIDLRQAWLLAHPGYAETLQAAAPSYRVVDDAATILTDDRFGSKVDRAFKDLATINRDQQQVLRAMAFDRRAAPLSFPPAADVEDVQKRLRQGDAVLMFHQAADSMNGFLIVAGGHHYWRLPNTSAIESRVAAFLNALGSANASASLSVEEAVDDAWRDAARELGAVIFKESRLDLAKTKRLMIVPDGALWHVPFEALIPPGSDNRPLIETTPIRYAPTLGLAAPNKQVMRRIRRTAVATPKPSDREGEEQAVERLAASASLDGKPAERLQPPVGAPSQHVASAFDMILSTVESQVDSASPYGWRPLSIDRNGGSLASWMRLSGRAPQRLALGGVHTAAENALKAGRRARRGAQPLPVGWEMFHAACGLMASGARTALVSRWTTAGQTEENLLREFVSEAPHTTATEAWRRSVSLAREARLEADLEPRLQATIDDEPPLAEHPLFWAGYLLLDNSFDPLDALPDEPAKSSSTP